MRHLAWLFAIAFAFLVMHAGTTTQSTKLSMGSSSMASMDIMEIQMRADKDMPLMVIADPI